MSIKYRKRPVVVEAVRWNPTETGRQIGGWPRKWRKKPGTWKVSAVSLSLFIPTLEGTHEAKAGDWIIRGVAGEFYPCKPSIFAMTYEPAGGSGGEATPEAGGER